MLSTKYRNIFSDSKVHAMKYFHIISIKRQQTNVNDIVDYLYSHDFRSIILESFLKGATVKRDPPKIRL